MNSMKKLMNLWLVAALLCGLSLGFASCKDDDNDGSENRTEAEAAENDEGVAALRWLVALTDTRELADNWASKTYEPTVGQSSTQNELCRVIVVSGLEEAKTEFASLAGIEIDGLDGTKTVTDQGVGTLTWTPSDSGADNVATVDVNSPLLPRLRQIVYCTNEQTGKNGAVFDNVKGTAYYRFGDVVKDNATGYYWVCVRPCFEEGDKGDSHWINIFNASASGDGKKIPEKYLQAKWDHKEKYGNAPIVLPTKLPADDKHTHNLAQLIQALLRPADYENACKLNHGAALGGFDYEYNGRLFVEAVAEFWKENTDNGYNVWQILFNRTYEQMLGFTELDFINQSYTWGLLAGNTASVYCYKSKDYRTSFKTSDNMAFDVTRGFDVRAYASDPDASDDIGNEMKQFYSYGANSYSYGRWVIRYASGKDLAKTFLNPSPYEPLPNTTNVYVYNLKTNKNVRTPLETERDLGATTDTRCYYHTGDVVRYNNRLYICATNHRLNEKARFVTLNDQQDHTIGTFNWSGVGKDSVYNDDMASSQTLFEWTKNVLFDTERYTTTRNALQAKGIKAELWNEVIPQTDQMRFNMMFNMMDYYRLILDATKGPQTGIDNILNSAAKLLPMKNVVYFECEGDEYTDPNFDPEDEDNIWEISAAPTGYLLADKMRYSEHVFSSWDQWVPYLYLVKDSQIESYQHRLDESHCMSTLSPSHFKWADLGTINIPEKIEQPEEHVGLYRNPISAGTYHVLLLAFYWQHEKVKASTTSYWRILLNFTFDAKVKGGYNATPDYTWDRRNITSREYIFTDNGRINRQLESVFVQREPQYD